MLAYAQEQEATIEIVTAALIIVTVLAGVACVQSTLENRHDDATSLMVVTLAFAFFAGAVR